MKNNGNDKYVDKFKRKSKERSKVKNTPVCTQTPQIRSRSNFKNLAATHKKKKKNLAATTSTPEWPKRSTGVTNITSEAGIEAGKQDLGHYKRLSHG